MTKIIRQGNVHEFAKSLDDLFEDVTLLLRRDMNGVEHLESWRCREIQHFQHLFFVNPPNLGTIGSRSKPMNTIRTFSTSLSILL